MKNKLFILLIIICMISFMSFNQKVNAESLKDMSFSKGENLLDPKWFSYDGQTIYSRRKTYLKYGAGSIYFQLEEEYLGNVPRVVVELFDIGFNSLGKLYSDDQYELTKCGDKNFGTACFDLSEYENAISFTFQFYPVLSYDFSATSVELMCFYGNSPKEEYIEYEDAIGIFDIENDHPAIEVEYNYPLNEDDIKELLDSYDAYDGNISNLLTIEAENYFNNSNKLGRYTVNVKSKDSSNNETTGFFYIDVVDYDIPQIAGPEKIDIPIYTEITDEYILKNYSAADGYDGDISSLMIVNGEYTKKPNNKGEETIKISVTDSSGNKNEKSINLVIFDNVLPTLNCPESLEYGYEVAMTLDKIFDDHISASDNIETDNVTLEIIKDTYTGNEKKVGEYEVEIVARDESLNETKKTLKIKVSDSIKPIIFINTYNLQITSSVNLERIDFDNLLYEWGILKREERYEVELLVDTYTGHEKEEGKYIVSLRYTSSKQEEITKNFEINVKNNSYVIEPVDDNKNNFNVLYIIIPSVSLGLISFMVFGIIKAKKKKFDSIGTKL